LFVVSCLLSCCYPDRYPDSCYPDCYPGHQPVSGSLTRNTAESLNEIKNIFPSAALLLRNRFLKNYHMLLATMACFQITGDRFPYKKGTQRPLPTSATPAADISSGRC